MQARLQNRPVLAPSAASTLSGTRSALMLRLLLALAVCFTPGAALNVGPLSLARPVATVPRAALIVCEEKVKLKGAQGRKRKSYIERLKGPQKAFLGRDTRVCKVPLL